MENLTEENWKVYWNRYFNLLLNLSVITRDLLELMTEPLNY
jgi:hypothetical protein